MRRVGLLSLLIALSIAADAQTPDAAVRLDARTVYSVAEQNQQRVRWYDRRGRYSVIELFLALETGNYVKISQRLQTIAGAADQENLDEYYVEDRGVWRIGKQPLPFGRRAMINETALAVRYDTELLIFDLPVAIAYADAGSGRQRGVVARVGDLAAVSVAVGDHFGIGAPSFTQFRRPEESPGPDRGYRVAAGADLAYPFAGSVLTAEAVFLRDGATPQDIDRELTDVAYTFTPKGTRYQFTVGWSRDWTESENYYRIEGFLPHTDQVSVEPFLRFQGSRWTDFGIAARVRL